MEVSFNGINNGQIIVKNLVGWLAPGTSLEKQCLSFHTLLHLMLRWTTQDNNLHSSG